MPATSQDEHEQEGLDAEEVPEPCQETLDKISAHVTRPGRTVLTEDGNTEAWIASDLTLEVEEIK